MKTALILDVDIANCRPVEKHSLSTWIIDKCRLSKLTGRKEQPVDTDRLCLVLSLIDPLARCRPVEKVEPIKVC